MEFINLEYLDRHYNMNGYILCAWVFSCHVMYVLVLVYYMSPEWKNSFDALVYCVGFKNINQTTTQRTLEGANFGELTKKTQLVK